LPTLLRAALDALPPFDTLLPAVVAATWESHPDARELLTAVNTVTSAIAHIRETLAAQETRVATERSRATALGQPWSDVLEAALPGNTESPKQHHKAFPPSSPTAASFAAPETQSLSADELASMSDDDLR
jgi:NAD-dependent oxidoreductase involved in siderophore biosynthesis